MNNPQTDKIKEVVLVVLGNVLTTLAVIFGLYLFFGFLDWLTTDPLNIIR